jgi:hypothetical protein
VYLAVLLLLGYKALELVEVGPQMPRIQHEKAARAVSVSVSGVVVDVVILVWKVNDIREIMAHEVLTVTNAALCKAGPKAHCSADGASSVSRTAAAHTVQGSIGLASALISDIVCDLVALATRRESRLDQLAVLVTKDMHASRSKMRQVAISNIVGVLLRTFMGRWLFRVEKVIISHVVLFHEVKETVVRSQRTKLFDVRSQSVKFLPIAPTIPVDKCQPCQQFFVIFSKICMVLNSF